MNINYDFSHKQLKMYPMRTTAAHVRAARFAGFVLTADTDGYGTFVPKGPHDGYNDALQVDLYERTLKSLQTYGTYPNAI